MAVRLYKYLHNAVSKVYVYDDDSVMYGRPMHSPAEFASMGMQITNKCRQLGVCNEIHFNIFIEFILIQLNIRKCLIYAFMLIYMLINEETK